ncbi:MAG: DNA cytosine methyltransferase [Gemmatimonadota bacterium]
MSLVLSLFPGIGLLDHAFSAEGFCVVRGPDLLWGGDVRTFHPPAGRFDGVIGGPPCQRWSRLAVLVRHVHGEEALAEDLIPEFARVVTESQPDWFLMENVPAAPAPETPGYRMQTIMLDNRHVDRGDGIGEVQRRVRRWVWGVRDDLGYGELDLGPELAVLESADYRPAVTAQGTEWCPALSRPGQHCRGRPVGRRTRANLAASVEAQGLPAGWSVSPPYTVGAALQAVGNGVPIPMGRALARAVRRAIA